ncbi:MAG: hypothetical protein R2705_13620 [Ilumatobacteraceae bacterium]
MPFILAAEQADGHRGPASGPVHPALSCSRSLSRIANVSLFLGDLGVQMGAVTPVFLAFRDREYVLNPIEGATGGRFHPNFDPASRTGRTTRPRGWIAGDHRS